MAFAWKARPSLRLTKIKLLRRAAPCVDTVDDLLVGQVAALAAPAVLGAEALGPAGLREGTDGAEAVVLQQDVDDLDVLELL